ncbi:MAG TPA: DUF5060 domain-containing protein [Herpetosiphonaceae bacterium]|nr:DUF5060 domain-containing protein [Herpetosiphonaceae bacterium]
MFPPTRPSVDLALRNGLAILLPFLLLSACQRAPIAQQPAASTSTTVPSTTTTSPAATTSPVKINSVQANALSIGRYEKIELSLDIEATYQNPFDPAQIDVRADFVAPDGQQWSVPAFYWQDYESTLTGGTEILAPRGEPVWKVRFTPTQEGQWSYSISAKTPAGSNATDPARLDVTPSDRHGFLRVDRRDSAYFAFDDGTPFVAIGQNVSWYGKGGTHDYERWFGKMHANGANFARLWMASWAMGIEWSDTGLGDYTKRLDRAWQLDRVFALAEQNDIYLMLSLLNHGAFSATVNPEWNQNPYNAALGGPCATPEEFATDKQARELFQRRLRYIAARWGYSPNLLAWEWWNEVDWTPLAPRAILAPWIEEMSGYLATLDPYQHLRTTSYGQTPDDAVFDMPQIDIVQRHVYETQDPSQSFPQGMVQMRRIQKPALYGEFGTGASGADSARDREGVHVHNGVWAGIMTKGSGTGMTWWWDTYIDPLDLYGVFAGPAAFLKDEDLAAAGYRPGNDRVVNGNAAALLLKSPTRVLGWVKNKDYSYNALQLQSTSPSAGGTDTGPSFTPVASAVLPILGIAPGSYQVEWWDTRGKGLLKTETIDAADGTARLSIPDLERDVAFKLIPSP